MLSIYNPSTTNNLCQDFCNGYTDLNGNKITGMLAWIKNRIDKELTTNDFKKSNKSNIQKITNFKNLLTDNKIKEILCSKPNELLIIWNQEFKVYKDVSISVKTQKNNKITRKNVNLISHIFNYSSFRNISSKNKFSGFLLAKLLKIECCPYCNRNYTTTHANYKNKKVFPEFDHFYHKSAYPLMAVSFYNLIPSCNVCNTYFKGSKDSIKENLFHPYTQLSKNALNFCFTPNNVSSLYGKNDDFSLSFTINDVIHKTSLESSLEFFDIKAIYELCHSDLIKEIVNKKISYSTKYLQTIKDTYNISFEESYKILFETYYEDDKIHERPFSKLKKDIFDDVNI